MIKWWNHQHSALLQSYHIEAMGLEMASIPSSDFPWEVFTFFREACGQAADALWYNGSYADAYLDAAKRQEVLKRLETARDKASRAWHLTYDDNNDHSEAIEIWRTIFGSKFPAYG